MREVASIALRRIDLSGSRPTVPETVNAMAKSLSDVGLINPITVVAAKVYVNSIIVDGYRVIAGNHRVAAARAIGWSDIEAFVIADDDRLANELREIDENLCRAELSPAQRAYSIKRRKEIWEQLHPDSEQTATTCRGLGGRGKTEFASETAEASGDNVRNVQRHASRAEALGDDLLEVTGTSLDKGVELDALKAMPEAERKELIQKAKAGEKVSARKPAEQFVESSALVVAVIRQLDIFNMVLVNSGVEAKRMPDLFLAQLDVTDEAVSEKLTSLLPLLDALARIANEIDLDPEVDE